MRKILVLLSICTIILFNFSPSSIAFDMTTLSGTAQFKSSLLSKYMRKHGYAYIEERMYGGHYKTNIFAASDAEVVVKNKYNTVLASAKTDDMGNFSVSVPRDNNYRIVVRFHDREIDELVSQSDAARYTADFGHFNAETVESWLQLPPLTYCHTCSIRQLEMNESM